MKESYGEGLASHTGPKSCVGVRKGAGEALTGVHAGPVLSRVIVAPPQGGLLRGADVVEHSGRPHRQRCHGEAGGPRAVGRPGACMETPVREPGDPTGVCSRRGGRAHREVARRTPMVNARGKSDSSVVPVKSPNKAATRAAEAMEGRGLAKGNSFERNARRTQCRESATSALERVRQAAKKDRQQRFTALLHHVYDIDRLRTAYLGIKRDAAAGVDGETWGHYGENLEGNLQDLAARLKRGAYRAQPVREKRTS